MDKDEKQINNINPNDLPAKSDDKVSVNEATIPEPPKPAEVKPSTSVSSQEENNKIADLNMTLPTLNIANSESVDENKKPLPANSVLDNKADFQSIFHVESEEVPEAKVVEKKSKDAIAPVVATNKEEKEETALPEDKQLTGEEEKKKKAIRKDNFNGEDRIIFQFQEEKEGNPMVVVMFFAILISVIFALPYVSKTLKYNNGTPTISNPDDPNNPNNTDDFFYFDRSSVRAKLGNLEFTNFVKHKKNNNTYTLTFNISNKQPKAYTFDEKYYVVFYRDDLIVYRALIYSKDPIGANAITSVEMDINEYSFSQSNRFKVQEILPSAYPTVTLSESEGEYRVLTCTYNYDEIRYYFIDNQLQKVKETYHETVSTSYNYTNSYEEHQNLSNEYKKIDKFTSRFISQASEFTMINEFDYKDIPDTVINNLNEYKFFRYNEQKDTIHFEMEALSYNCG